VRELGFLDNDLAGTGLTHSQCHAMIELEHHGTLTAGELAQLLNLDKSTMSRTIAQLLRAGQVVMRGAGAGDDKRRKPLALTKKGAKKLAECHKSANRQVNDALAMLTPDDRNTVLRGMSIYAKALGRIRAQSEMEVRPIRGEDDPEVAKIIRTVMPEFGADGPGFAIHDAEVSAMSEAYAGDGAEYFVLTRNGRIVGGAGFAALKGGQPGICELRKMYFLPEARGAGMGRRLLLHVLDRAARAGYKRCYLETLENMVQARRLYESAGFTKLKRSRGETGHFSCDAFYERKLTVE
jgi:putative acetyltransferase